MTRIIKIIGLILAILIGIVLLYLLVAFCLSIIAVNKKAVSKEEVTIYILSNGVHTDIVVPVKSEEMDWSKHVKYEDTKGNDTTAQLVGFGWGDKGFYLATPNWSDLKFSVAFNAAFARGSSAMHVTFLHPLTESESCKRIQISKTEYKKLVDYIQASFQQDQQGNFVRIDTDAQYGSNDAFYEAKGRYNLFYTCNTWTNNALKVCDQRASLWTPFDRGIFYHYSK
ncbi:TIGR02117 family protein [Sphingobacterium corticibacter]|uniref:TIGR02117 family protein n=1 Tax=Sphingobacterium corticibacter TaxID=2171749 RepID=A0A2T8HFE9_9SPHI|nr:TIGR02117 family protein [Sphingobacterium corticibacter]PVH24167.1 TIGR02117 family protein [Sphingobacterium corticibacter]